MRFPYQIKTAINFKNKPMGKVAVIKTRPGSDNVEEYIDNMPDEQKRKDSHIILKMMGKAIKEKPKLWGSSMIGFGDKRYKSPTSGREADWFMIGFAPRKANISLHLCLDVQRFAPELKKLGKHKTGMGCLYINKLDDVDVKVLEKIISSAAKLARDTGS
jgi:hypothetical protein